MNPPFLPRYDAGRTTVRAIVVIAKDQLARLIILVLVVTVYAGIPVAMAYFAARAF